MIEWIDKHYKILTGIAVPLVVAIIGIFHPKSFKKLKTKIFKNKNNVIIANGNKSSHAFNTSSNNLGEKAIQVVGNNTQINQLDFNAVRTLAVGFLPTMFPHFESAAKKFQLNAESFLAHLNSELSHLSPSEFEKFSEIDVQVALQNAIKSAARWDSPEIHKILGKLIADRVQKPKQTTAELTINEAIEISAKLDINLIKILALSFLFSRTKYSFINNETTLIYKLALITADFKDLEVSTSKFEYLEAISCGSLSLMSQPTLINIILTNYPQLFLKSITAEQVQEIINFTKLENLFIEINNESYQLNPNVALYLFEDAPIKLHGSPFQMNNEQKEYLKKIFNKNRLNANEVKNTICTKVTSFQHLITLWDQKDFSKFSLTAVGIAIGRAYLDNKKLGNFDINTWIN